MFGAMPGTASCRSPNRRGPSISAPTTSSVHRSPTRASASARGEGSLRSATRRSVPPARPASGLAPDHHDVGVGGIHLHGDVLALAERRRGIDVLVGADRVGGAAGGGGPASEEGIPCA